MTSFPLQLKHFIDDTLINQINIKTTLSNFLHTSTVNHWWCPSLRGTAGDTSSQSQWGNNRSVMPLEVPGRNTCYTERCSESSRVPASGEARPCNDVCAGERRLQLFVLNEFLVGASHQLESITSLPFVHTTCCYYRSNSLVRPSQLNHALLCGLV